MSKKEKFWKWKLPLYTLLTEAAIGLLVMLPLIGILSGGQGITRRLLSGGSADDGITGWLVLPALLGDAVVGIALIALVALLVVYLVMVGGSLGWSILFHHLNQKNSWSLCIAAEAPALLVSGGAILYLLRQCIEESSAGALIASIPMLLLLAEALLQIRHMVLLHR